jgi:tetratricopeptide (TPR) repeat protein
LAELIERLKTTVGGTYRIEKELGGGGMSRVFLAEEIELGRRVVIKVLPPEMAAEVNKERFHREIQLAARLQHPHVVSLLTAGAEGDLLYYVMPYIEGESLRAKLSREGELPIEEAVLLLEEVVDALAYAHSEGVVHRDIKPDNVLLSRDHAVVTDFGVSKAVSASSGASSLTSLGVALGTPAYMAPEQAAADPHTDHRADIYAVGAMAYEMLTGRPPFTAPTPQAVMAAHVSEAPEPVTRHRSTVSEALNALVMRCLEKKAADRWQSASELVPQLKAMATPSGGVTPTGTQPVAAVSAETAARQAHPVRVAGLFGLASIGVLAIVYALVQAFGLPDWVLFGAIGLLALGLPIMMLTGHHERQRAIARTAGMQVTTPAQGVRRWFTWRRALVGGGAGFAGLAVIATVYMAMRLLGIGPVGTLVASGVLDEQDRLILADFENRTEDSALGGSLTEALRVGLSQSRVIKLVDASTVGQALGRMNRDPATPLHREVTLEVAEREGVPAIVLGEVGPIGRGYVLSAQVLSAVDGSELLTVGTTANDDGELIAAIDELSGKLRERIGESLKTIRAGAPLERVTTSSMQALRLFTQAIRAAHIEGNTDVGISLLEDAIALDSGFAMAYRQLSVLLGNSAAEPSLTAAAATKAFEFRDRLPEIERFQATAFYYMNADYDRSQTIRAYRSLLERDPDNVVALNNLAVTLIDERRYAEAESLVTRGLEFSGIMPLFFNKQVSQTGQRKFTEARATIDLASQRLPESPYPPMWHGYFVSSVDGDYDEMEATLARVEREMQPDLVWQMYAGLARIGADQVRGMLEGSERQIRDFMRIGEERSLPRDYLSGAIELGYIDVRYRGAPDNGARKVEAALERYPLESMVPPDRPYAKLAAFYATVSRLAEAKRLLTEYDELVPEGLRRANPLRHAARGAIAVAEERGSDAVAAYRQWYDEEDDDCTTCGLFEIGEAYELVGEPDSALAYYERAIATPSSWKVTTQYYWLPQAHVRLGEMYEERDEIDKAIDHYSRFVELWKDADAELQPVVEEVRGRIVRLVGER